jgi:hypothetical protein
MELNEVVYVRYSHYPQEHNEHKFKIINIIKDTHTSLPWGNELLYQLQSLDGCKPHNGNMNNFNMWLEGELIPCTQ